LKCYQWDFFNEWNGNDGVQSRGRSGERTAHVDGGRRRDIAAHTTVRPRNGRAGRVPGDPWLATPKRAREAGRWPSDRPVPRPGR